MTGEIECRYHGRDFTVEEMALLRALIAGPPARNRLALSKGFCRRIGWRKPDGGLKDMVARLTMLAMHRDDRITLPPPQRAHNRPGKNVRMIHAGPTQAAIGDTACTRGASSGPTQTDPQAGSQITAMWLA